MDVNGPQLRAARGVLQESDIAFGGESAYEQSQLTLVVIGWESNQLAASIRGHEFRVGSLLGPLNRIIGRLTEVRKR